MSGIRKRMTVTIAAFAVAALFIALGVSMSSADEPQKPAPAPTAPPRLNPPAVPQTPNGEGFNSADFQKAQDQMLKAMEALAKDPNDAAARKMMAEAQEMMMKALNGGVHGFMLPGVDFPQHGFPQHGIGRSHERGRLGVMLEPVSPIVADQLGLESGKGVAIAAVLNGSAAEKAGFKAHDIVVEFAGKPVVNPADFAHRVNAVKAGEKVDAVVMRKGKRVELKGIDLPAPQPAPQHDALPTTPKATEKGQVKDSASVEVANGAFTIKATQEGVNYVITGKTKPDGAVVEKVNIKAGNEAIEAQEIGKVPEMYRPTVEKLLTLVGKPSAKVKD
jgi:membrane-associated protease RseP (regulator of RpoE activity)